MECAAGKGVERGNLDNSPTVSQGGKSISQREVQNKRLHNLELDGGWRKKFKVATS